MNIIAAGKLPILEELTGILLESGHQVSAFLVEDYLNALESGSIVTEEADFDVAIDLINESIPAKMTILKSFEIHFSDEMLILTSALPVSATQAAAWLETGQRVTGFGLISPLSVGDTVEVCYSLQSIEPYQAQALEFWRSLDFEPILVADSAGLVRPRILCCLINEAASALSEGVASAENIDLAMKLGTRYPRGPLEWADLIGLDSVLGVMEGLFSEFGDDRYRPTPQLRRMVAAGMLGVKSGVGFYNYNQAGSVE